MVFISIVVAKLLWPEPLRYITCNHETYKPSSPLTSLGSGYSSLPFIALWRKEGRFSDLQVLIRIGFTFNAVLSSICVRVRGHCLEFYIRRL